jgi:CheY-like chemotaxis protein
VFEPFFTTKRFGLGSGLGLSMATASSSSRAATSRSTANRPGHTVLIALPLAPDAPAPTRGDEVLRPAAAACAAGRGRGQRAPGRPQQLVDLGHPVIEAENGAQALEMIGQIADIAFVVSDVIMPGGLNGHRLAAEVRRLRPAVGIVLISGYDDETAEADSGLPVLAKPFGRQDLARALARSHKEATP